MRAHDPTYQVPAPGATVPPTTAAILAEPWAPGTRHMTAKRVAVSLVGAGWAGQSVFDVLRNKCEEDMPDKELADIVNWALKAQPAPPSRTVSATPPPFQGQSPLISNPRAIATPSSASEDPLPSEKVKWWTNSEEADMEAVAKQSPLALPGSDWECANLAFAHLYAQGELINIVTHHTMQGDKARPGSAGTTQPRDAWMDQFARDGQVPCSEAGAWLRMNPVNEEGVGDANVTAFRYLLLESDVLPLPQQLALLTRLRLPVAMILTSGANSAHAWVRMEASSAEQYKAIASRIMAALKPFGIDQANSNPSRLSRLPGARRVIGAAGDGRQRLLWLKKTNAAPLTEVDLLAFEDSLKAPTIDPKPLKAVALHALERYDQLIANKGHLGVPWGIPALDEISGGMKKGHTIVVAGVTGGGKTTFALHLITTALNAGYGVALFTLEQDRDEIFDLLVSHQCSISRNKFNNGAFVEYDQQLIANHLPKLMQLPLYIEDSPSTTVEDIRARVLRLKADGRISLVVVDYVQFINPSLKTRDSREQEVAGISHALRRIALESKLPMVVLSQLNDEGKLRESRVIAHNANVVIQVQMEQGGDQVALQVVKGRSVPCGTHKMSFERQFCRFRPITT